MNDTGGSANSSPDYSTWSRLRTKRTRSPPRPSSSEATGTVNLAVAGFASSRGPSLVPPILRGERLPDRRVEEMGRYEII